MLIALTLNTGAVIIVEPKYESSTEIKVYNLDTGEEESFPKAKGYRKVSATEAKYLAGTMATRGKQPERLEALFARPLTSAAPELFSRLGKYPNNAAAYLAWAAKRLVPVNGDSPGTLAVLPLHDTRGSVTEETTMRTEEITNALGRRRVPMVERGQFSKVLSELHLESGQAFDPAMAQKFGRQVGAQAVLIGTLVPRGAVADLNLRLIETQTGRLLDSPTILDVPRGGSTAPRTSPVPSLVGEWDVRLPGGNQMGFTATPDRLWRNSKGGNGTWTQSGLKLVLYDRALKPDNSLGPVILWEGEIDPDGLTFHVNRSGGGIATGVRR
jgi:TolB-like protein